MATQPAPAAAGHNSAVDADDRLRLLVERVERLEGEKKGIQDDIKDAYAEGKLSGYDVKMMKFIVAARKIKPDDWREMQMLRETYCNALGLPW